MADPTFQLDTETKGSETILRATGRITLETSSTLDSTLRAVMAEGKRVILDLANVDYVDSAGLGTLVGAHLHAKRTKCHLEIANPKQRIRDLFNRSGLASVFDSHSFDALWEAWSRGGS